MEYNSVRHKLNKYKNKMNLETNQNKKTLYAEKVGMYRQMLQSGGKMAEMISTHISKLKETTESITNKFPSGDTLDPQLVQNLETGIHSLTQTFGTYTEDTLDATIKFAEYNAAVREELRKILQKVRELKPLDQQTLSTLQTIASQLNDVKLAEITFNETTIVKLGILLADDNEEKMQHDMAEITSFIATEKAPINFCKKQWSLQKAQKLN